MGTRRAADRRRARAEFTDAQFAPLTNGRYDLDIVELSPGGGRFTAELIRYAATMTLVDMNRSASPSVANGSGTTRPPIEYHVNDGTDLTMILDDRGRQCEYTY